MSDLAQAKEYFLNCVSAVINGGEIPAMPGEVDEKTVFSLAVRNSAQALLYFANEECRIFSDELTLKLKKSYQAAMLREMSQQAEIEKIRKEFAENGISFMLLKGSHLKALYPKPEMRFMVDMDVLVRKADVEKAREILISHGLRQSMNNGKDIVLLKEPFLTVELHNTLFMEDYYMYDYFLGVWDRAEKVSDFEYKMSDADLYIYSLAHLAEHYTTAGACFRPTMDIYLMNKKVNVLNTQEAREYISAELEKLELNSFEENIKKVGLHIFEDGQLDGNTELMEKYIVFGPPVKHAAQAAKANKSKSSRIISALFPGLRHMKNIYPVLEKLPFLLPFMWIARILKNLFNKNAKTRLESIESTDISDYKVLENIYISSGLKKY